MTTTFAVSNHALSRALDMAVEGVEIRDAFERPRSVYHSPRTDSDLYTRGRITLCVRISPQGIPTVTTILWAKPSGWAADADYAPIDGRGYEDFDGARRVAKARKRSRA